MGNNNVLLAYANLLKMYSFHALPSSLPSVDEGMLSRLPMTQTSARPLDDALSKCERCPAQTHAWARSVISWRGLKVHFHSVHVDWSAGVGETQVNYIAQQLQLHFASGPMILVGNFNMPHNATMRPHDTVLRRFATLGLREALATLEPTVKLPLPETSSLSGLHVDYIFYRGFEVAHAKVLADVKCSDHFPVVAALRLPVIGSR